MTRRTLTLLVLAACNTAIEPEGRAPWSVASPLPVARADAAVAGLGQRVTVVGGLEPSGPTSTVVWLDPVTLAWSELPAMPLALSDANVGTAGASLYVLGGLGPTARGEAYALDTLTEPTWREIRPLPVGLERGAAAVIVARPFILLLGGTTGTEAVATNLAYNLVLDEWTDIPRFPAPRSHAAAMRMSDGTLVVAGGFDGARAYDDVLVLSPGARAWAVRPTQMPTPRGGCAYGTIVDQLVCAGGHVAGTAVAATHSYDPIRDVWSEHPDLPEPRMRTRGAVIGGRLYVPGGASAPQNTPASTVYAFAFLDTLIP